MREENLLAKVRETMTQFQMLNAGDTVVIGVSGGPDSICLLDVLDRLTEEFAIRLQAVHVNHMLRREAQEEEQYVEEFCRQREIPCRIFIKYKGICSGERLVDRRSRQKLSLCMF